MIESKTKKNCTGFNLKKKTERKEPQNPAVITKFLNFKTKALIIERDLCLY